MVGYVMGYTGVDTVGRNCGGRVVGFGAAYKDIPRVSIHPLHLQGFCGMA